MAKDHTGNHVNKGDKVMVPCVVAEVEEVTDEQPLNLTLETVRPSVGGSTPSRFRLAGTQVDLVGGAPASAPAPAETTPEAESPEALSAEAEEVDEGGGEENDDSTDVKSRRKAGRKK